MSSQLLSNEYVFLKKKGIFYKIFLQDIAYFEADGDYLKVQLSNDKQYSSQTNLSNLAANLPSEHFLRIHRSFLVNISQVEAIDFVKNELKIGEMWLPFSRTKKKELKNLVTNKTIGL